MSEDFEVYKEKNNRLYQALSVVGNLILPLEEEERVLDIMAEQIIRAARIRSLVFALIYKDRGYVDIVRRAHFNRLTDKAGYLTEHSTSNVERLVDWREDMYNTKHSFICYAAREGTQVIINGNHENVDPNADEWIGKVAYFVRLQHADEPVAVLAGACSLEQADHALDWAKDIEPLTDLIAAQIRTLRVLKEQRFLAYRPPQEANLSAREQDVLRRVALGESATQIAEEMDLSPRTVHTYKRRICKKLDRYSQADLTRYAIMTELIPLTDR